MLKYTEPNKRLITSGTNNLVLMNSYKKNNLNTQEK